MSRKVKHPRVFIFSLIALTILSLIPLVGYYFADYLAIGVTSVCLLLLTFGVFKLNKITIVFWIVLISILLLYLLIILVYKLTGGFVNSFYSYKSLLSGILFLSSTLTSLISIKSIR